GGQVHIEDGLPILVLHAQREIVASDAGVVDQDVDFAERCLGVVAEAVYRFGIGEIGGLWVGGVAVGGGQVGNDGWRGCCQGVGRRVRRRPRHGSRQTARRFRASAPSASPARPAAP